MTYDIATDARQARLDALELSSEFGKIGKIKPSVFDGMRSLTETDMAGFSQESIDVLERQAHERK